MTFIGGKQDSMGVGERVSDASFGYTFGAEGLGRGFDSPIMLKACNADNSTPDADD